MNKILKSFNNPIWNSMAAVPNIIRGSKLPPYSTFNRRSIHCTTSTKFPKSQQTGGGEKDSTSDKNATPTKEPGWFSRLLGIQHIEPIQAAHSSMLADTNLVYEMISHQIIPADVDQYLNLYELYVNKLAERQLPAKLVGSWTVKFGNQDEIVHLWRYQNGYTGTDQLMDILQTDSELKLMQKQHVKLCRKRKNELMLAFTYWGDPKPRPPKHIYEMRSYILRAGTMIEWGNNWVKGINHRRDYHQDVAGFFTQVGHLYKVVHFWAYDSLSARKKIREDTWSKPGWDTTVAYTVPLIRQMESKVMVPNNFSPLQ